VKTRADDYLAQASLLRLLAVLGLVVLPHFFRMPPWMSLGVVAIGVWRAAAALRQWPLPPTWLKVLLSLAAFAAVNLSYGRINGQHAGAALLVVMLALKLTEMRSRRDVLVVVGLCYFVMVTHFLFSQEPWTVLYLLACAVAVTALLIEANHIGGALTPRVTLRMGASLVAQALPLMVLLFVLFPRVPGPLWGLPSDSGSSRSGLTDSMSPGDIQHMIGSEDVAFRVRFFGPPPRPEQMYWRGPVFTHFNGQRWSALFNGDDYFASYRRRPGDEAYQEPQAEFGGDPIRYEVTLEPHRQNWLLALDLPDPQALPPNAALTGYYQLMSRDLVREIYRYEAQSYTRFRLDPVLTPEARRTDTRVPRDRNPRTQEMATAWRAEGLTDEQVIRRALQMFREKEFVYTLDPPKLGEEMVDEFLFDTRRGFCEHYAGSFTVLMRAAGIPARVVAGYLGGEQNSLGDYFVIHQYDAHAWTEVWLEGQGWVRIDPTAAVAPSRIESGLAAALAPGEGPSFLRRGGFGGIAGLQLRLDVAWDMVNVAWDRWVLAYGPQLQLELLSRFGMDDWSKMVIALTLGIVGSMSLVGSLALWRSRPTRNADRALELWRRATRVLARAGLEQQPAEGPTDFAERVARQRPELAVAIRRLAGAYVSARYFGLLGAEAELAVAVRELRL
jgi:transglutaminase-like putative cysteine protease